MKIESRSRVEASPSRQEMITLIRNHVAISEGKPRVLPVAQDLLLEILNDDHEIQNDWICFSDKNICNTVLRFICTYRIPLACHKYNSLMTDCVSYLDYYSKSIVDNDGSQVRIPRAVNGVRFADAFRARGKEILVIESLHELDLWFLEWGGEALITTNLVAHLDSLISQSSDVARSYKIVKN